MATTSLTQMRYRESRRANSGLLLAAPGWISATALMGWRAGSCRGCAVTPPAHKQTETRRTHLPEKIDANDARLVNSHVMNSLPSSLSTANPPAPEYHSGSTRNTDPFASTHPTRSLCEPAGKLILISTRALHGGQSSASTNAPRTLTSRVRPSDSRIKPCSIQRKTTGISNG